MKEKEQWENLGAQMDSIVRNACESNDFSQLSQNISDVIGDVIGTIDGMFPEGDIRRSRSRARRAYGAPPFGRGGYGMPGGYGMGQGYGAPGGHQDARQATAGGYGTPQGQGAPGGYQDARQSQARGYGAEARSGRPKPLIRKPLGKGRATLQEALGYFFGAIFLISFCGILQGFSFSDFLTDFVSAALLGILAFALFRAGYRGTKKRRQIGRFQKYIRAIGDLAYCDLDDLAYRAGCDEDSARKDVREMIRIGIFPEGHLDRQETCLMLTDEIYQQYRETQARYDEEQGKREREQGMRAQDGDAKASSPKGAPSETQRDAAAGAGEAQGSEEYRSALREGEAYIRHIEECRDRIQNPEMKKKLDRLHTVVREIFDELKKDPDKLSDLRRMMSYYMPTTRKLMDSYYDLENQPISGENIKNSLREIEKSFDLLNGAFEKLFDDLFQDTSWDISSDISVLKTMLAQDGYAEDAPQK